MAETKTVNLDIKTNIGSLKSQLRQAQAEVAALSDKFGATSTEAANAAKKAAELKDRIEDAKNLTDAFNPDAKFNALSSSIGGVLNGFQAYEGAMGLIGIESEELQKTLLKVQSAMALSQGIQGALEAKDSFIQLGAVVKNMFSGMTTAAKAFAVTGIGLLVTGVGILIANWDTWFGTSKKVEEQQKLIAEQAKEQRQNIAKESGEFATLISRLKNTNQGSKERADLIKKINGQYGTTLKNIKDEAKFQESLNKELASYLEYQKAKYQLQKNEELIVKNLEKQDEIQSKINKAKKELPNLLQQQQKWQKELDKTSATDTNMVAFYAEKIREAKDAVSGQRKEISKLEGELAKAEKRFNAYGSAANNASAKVDSLTNSGTKYVEQTKELVEEQEFVFTGSVQAFQEAAIDIDTLDKQLYEDMKARDALDLEAIMADNQLKIDANADLQQALTDAALERIRIEEEAEADKQRKFKENLKTSVELSIQGLNLIASIAEFNAGEDKKRQKTAFNIKKAANIASATMDGYNAVLSTFADTKGGVVLKSIAASIAGGFAALQIAGIAKQQFNGGESTSGGFNGSTGSTGGGVMSPNFNIVGNSGFNQLAQIQQQPIQAYVVSGEVTSAQALDRNRIKNATL